MAMKIDSQRLENLIAAPPVVPSALELRREGEVFFIGANLPVFETLETMYESLCQGACSLFVVTFAGCDELQQNLELVLSIKKNFSVRIMGRITYDLPGSLYEQLYLAGLDLLDTPVHDADGALRTCHHERIAERAAYPGMGFPRWSVCSSLQIDNDDAALQRKIIDDLLASGIVPLLNLPVDGATASIDDAIALYGYLADAWQRHQVPIKPLLPLVRLLTPLEPIANGGFLRSAIDRFHDRRQLVTSDLCRHLRTSGAEASFESAGL